MVRERGFCNDAFPSEFHNFRAGYWQGSNALPTCKFALEKPMIFLGNIDETLNRDKSIKNSNKANERLSRQINHDYDTTIRQE